MKFTVYAVNVIKDDKGERVSFEFGNEKEMIMHSQVFMINDVEKALRSTSIWTKNLLPDVSYPNVKGLVAFKKITEEAALAEVLKLHLEGLTSLIGKEVDIFVQTNTVNGIRYTNWVPYDPTVSSTTPTTEFKNTDDLKMDEDLAEAGF